MRVLSVPLTFLILVGATIFYVSPGQLGIREVEVRGFPQRVSDFPDRPPEFRLQVYSPRRAYESEAIRVTAITFNKPHYPPMLFRIEASKKLEIQGDTDRTHVGSGSAKFDWILIPKEQGEYLVVLRAFTLILPSEPTYQELTSLRTEMPLSVYKLDNVPRRWFVAGQIIGAAIAGLIVAAIGIRTFFQKNASGSKR